MPVVYINAHRSADQPAVSMAEFTGGGAARERSFGEIYEDFRVLADAQKRGAVVEGE